MLKENLKSTFAKKSCILKTTGSVDFMRVARASVAELHGDAGASAENIEIAKRRSIFSMALSTHAAQAKV